MDHSDNCADVAEAVNKHKIAREKVFITTKVRLAALASPPRSEIKAQVIPGKDDQDLLGTCRRILQETTLSYVDCFLIHTPSAGPAVREKTWKALEQLHKEGLARSIGVSNYGVAHLKEMERYATMPPCLNQIELHPFFQQKDIVTYCEEKGIPLEA